MHSLNVRESKYSKCTGAYHPGIRSVQRAEIPFLGGRRAGGASVALADCALVARSCQRRGTSCSS